MSIRPSPGDHHLERCPQALASSKAECANHACKCYRSSLEKLAADNRSYKCKGGLTEKMRKRLTSAARCAVKMRSQEPDKNEAARLLERDLLNGPLHCFGYHDKCSADFCSTARDHQIQLNSHSNVPSSNPSLFLPLLPVPLVLTRGHPLRIQAYQLMQKVLIPRQ